MPATRAIRRKFAHMALAGLLVVGCGAESSLPADPSAGSTSQPTSPASSAPTPAATSELETPLFGDQVAFWSSAALPGALEVHLQRTLEDMIRDSTAVIFGTVIGEVEGPEIDEDAPDGTTFHLTAHEVRVDELVAGSLPVGGDTVLVAARMALDPEHAPQTSRTLMFLMWGGRLYEEGQAIGPPEVEEWDRSIYGIVSSQGLYVEGPEGAWNPIAEAQEGYRSDDPTKLVDPVAEEARQYTLDELAELARTIKADQS